ncbi:short-chain fatty acid transporter [Kribbella sp. CA-253562]|uniref:short-chain fatty acid transporter n=1 Tax=Kribbella sp. CA-253562 TaxID=3239942 RepID=UPI003D9276BB
MHRLTKPFTVLVERFYPDPFVFAIVLSGVIFLGCLSLTDAGPKTTLYAWGDGLDGLMAFIGQLALTLVASHALAHTDAVRRMLEKVGGLPRRQATAYALVAFIAGVSSLVSWALGLVVGALIARQVAIQARKRGIRLHYPLLVASAYGGFVLWSMGYSSSAALFVATPGHTMESKIGIIPVTETIFSPWNVGILLVGLLVITVLMALLRPRKDSEIVEISEEAVAEYEASGLESDHQYLQVTDGPVAPGGATTLTRTKPTFGERLDNNRLLSIVPGLALTGYVALYFVRDGFGLTLDIVNWTFVALGLLLARSLRHYMVLVGRASATVGEIILQYPFYAGMAGMMGATGLVAVMGGWFVDVSSASTLSFWGFVSAGLINVFIPSGGGQWVVQGPIFLEAAQTLGVAPSRVVMGVALGEWTNMIQPFWTIPLLAIAGLRVRQVMGYTFVVLIVFFVLYGGGLLLAGSGM